MNIINTKNAPKVLGAYNQGIEVKGNIIFLSGQIGILPKTGILEIGVFKQVEQSLKNIQSILASINLKVSNIVKTTLFIVNFSDFEIINDAYKNFFKKNKAFFPARSCIQVSKLPKNAEIEIDAIAYSE